MIGVQQIFSRNTSKAASQMIKRLKGELDLKKYLSLRTEINVLKLLPRCHVAKTLRLSNKTAAASAAQTQ